MKFKVKMNGVEDKNKMEYRMQMKRSTGRK